MWPRRIGTPRRQDLRNRVWYIPQGLPLEAGSEGQSAQGTLVAACLQGPFALLQRAKTKRLFRDCQSGHVPKQIKIERISCQDLVSVLASVFYSY